MVKRERSISYRKCESYTPRQPSLISFESAT
jgi:hypothetical protein